MARKLDWSDCQNVRDLGGLPRDGGFTRSGVLIRSDNIGQLTRDGLHAMVAYGVSTVIDLRTQEERAGRFDPRFPRPDTDARRAPELTYLHVPLVEELERKINATTAVGRYIQIVDERQASFGSVFRAIAQAEGAVLFHCFAGKDRTGLVAAMLLDLAGVSRDHIAADYGETDVQLAKQYDVWISQAAPEMRDEIRGDLCCSADRILGVLDHVDATWGGVAAYMDACGVPPDAIDRLGMMLA